MLALYPFRGQPGHPSPLLALTRVTCPCPEEPTPGSPSSQDSWRGLRATHLLCGVGSLAGEWLLRECVHQQTITELRYVSSSVTWDPLYPNLSAGTAHQANNPSEGAARTCPPIHCSLGYFGGEASLSLPHQAMKSGEGRPPRDGLGVYTGGPARTELISFALASALRWAAGPPL